MMNKQSRFKRRWRFLLGALLVVSASASALPPGQRPRIDTARFNLETKPYLEAQARLSAAERLKTAKAFEGFLYTLPPERVSWASLQTPIRNQTDRNTCSIFAMVAAIEARYKRQFGLTLDLSEQFAWHLYKSSGVSVPNIYLYENQSSYWGGGGSHGIREMMSFVIPLESFAPYQNQTGMDAIRRAIPEAGALAWMADPVLNRVTQAQVDAFEYSTRYIPTAARQNAKYGVASYTLLAQADVRDMNRMETLIAAGNEVMTDIRLNWQYNATTGILEHKADAAGGDHVFLVVGYDRPGQFFWVKNSWGETGLLKVAYEVFRREAHSGAIVNSVTDPNRPNIKSRTIGVWNMDHDGWKGKLTVRRTTNESNAVTRLGHYVASDGRRRAVNGLAIDGGRGVRFALTNSEYPSLTDMSGQIFEADLYSWDVSYASGFTTSGGTPYGVSLTRNAEFAPYGNNFTRAKWIGSWNMNHDGWRGTLTIDRFDLVGGVWRVVGSYRDVAGALKAVSGNLVSGREHVLQLNVHFSATSSQAFTLHFHTWAERLFSGYTHNGGARFGVHGRR